MKLNQKILEEQIEILEKGVIVSTIELIKLPIFVKQIDKELEITKNKEKIKGLKDLLENNKLQEKGHKENLENLELILEEVYKLRE